ncbi:UDP-N-acetylmuramoyl-tripeptide--D-alanyl-D-alanine ligase [Aquipuribacter hungaricus]|uniref:UDP-N-acetylmuramoyl-tripeptide--D-alanyl-D- alanine ligase n=1 Tax=Aquipuribacter hungaricus TaxID=545624 RepID=UPI003606FB62
MIAPDAAGLADLVGGRLVPAAGGTAPAPLTGVATVDSRTVQPGDLFVALPGEHADGLDFAAAALAAGAAAVLAEREPDGPLDGPVVVVGVGVAALTALAAAHHADLRSRGLRTVGITGSAGKTTTKDLLAEVLRQGLPGGTVVATHGSYNNEIGLPLTVLRAGTATRVLVLEMGARGPGHVRHLCEVARPDVAVVLGVGSAHLGEFGSREAIALAKGELVEALDASRPGSVAVLGGDDPVVRAMASRTTAPAVLVGEGEGTQVRALDVDLDADARLRFDLLDARPAAAPGQAPVPVRLGLVGEQHLVNALAAAAAALELGLPPEVVARALGEARPASRHRMEVVDRPDGIRVVDDAYNASPEAVAAALRALAHMGRSARPPRRTWAVLGEMLELGEHSRVEHDRVGRLAVRLNIDRLVAVGQGALHYDQGATQEGSWGEESVLVDDIDAARRLLADELRPGDVVLLKASNSVGLWRLADELARGGSPASPAAAQADPPGAPPRTAHPDEEPPR